MKASMGVRIHGSRIGGAAGWPTFWKAQYFARLPMNAWSWSPSAQTIPRIPRSSSDLATRLTAMTGLVATISRSVHGRNTRLGGPLFLIRSQENADGSLWHFDSVGVRD